MKHALPLPEPHYHYGGGASAAVPWYGQQTSLAGGTELFEVRFAHVLEKLIAPRTAISLVGLK